MFLGLGAAAAGPGLPAAARARRPLVPPARSRSSGARRARASPRRSASPSSASRGTPAGRRRGRSRSPHDRAVRVLASACAGSASWICRGLVHDPPCRRRGRHRSFHGAGHPGGSPLGAPEAALVAGVLAGLSSGPRDTLCSAALAPGRAQCRTWDCGYTLPDARMQYTASSFAAPLTGTFPPGRGCDRLCGQKCLVTRRRAREDRRTVRVLDCRRREADRRGESASAGGDRDDRSADAEGSS